MRRILATSAVTLLLLLPAGCGRTNPVPAVVKDAPASGSTLTLESSSGHAKNGVVYIEGAVPRFRLTDTAGNQIQPDPGPDREAPTYSGLAAGTYTLNAGQRPCDGNCGYLDPLTDRCKKEITVSDDLTVHVAFTDGAPCRISLG
jgi:hypothetical protein